MIGKIVSRVFSYTEPIIDQLILMIISIFKQVSREQDGKIVDARCHGLTASHIRGRHQYDSNVPICDFYEVIYVAII